jgi:hypothetical protein
MIENIDKYKFVVTTGCSYGVLFQQTITHTRYSDKNLGPKIFNSSENVIVINVASQSLGAGYQCDSMIYTINALKKLGVSTKNIYSYTQFSEIRRMTWPVNSYFWKKQPELFPKFTFGERYIFNVNKLGQSWCTEEEFEDEDDVLKSISNELNIRGTQKAKDNPVLPITFIDNMAYITPDQVDLDDIDDTYGIEIGTMYRNYKKIEQSMPIEAKLQQYFNYILKLQYFLKSENIKYNCSFIYNQLSGWKYEGEVLTKSNSDYLFGKWYHGLKFNPNKLEEFLPKYDLINQVPHIKPLYNQIDWSKFWMYNKNGIRNGGIDEYIIDNFGAGSYSEVNPLKNCKDLGKIQEAEYTNHPNIYLYCTIWNNSTKDCDFLKVSPFYLQKIEGRFWEDWNNEGDEVSINNITVSKKVFKNNFITNII